MTSMRPPGSGLRRTERQLVRKVRHAERIAERGDSAETPLILLGDVLVVVTVVVVALLAVSLLAYDLAR
jgi:hypothetical protein